jgi:hypothetical protein
MSFNGALAVLGNAYSLSCLALFWKPKKKDCSVSPSFKGSTPLDLKVEETVYTVLVHLGGTPDQQVVHQTRPEGRGHRVHGVRLKRCPLSPA